MNDACAGLNLTQLRARRLLTQRVLAADWPRSLVLVFPATRVERDPYMTAPRIEEAARRRFEEWGGVARLAACGREYARR